MNRSIAGLMSILMLVEAPAAFAYSIDAVADEQILASRDAAGAYARDAVNQDLSQLIERMLLRLGAFASTLELPRVYGQLLDELETEFTAMKHVSSNDLPPTAQVFAQLTNRFNDTIRKKFYASWIPLVRDAEFVFAQNMLRDLVRDARNTCAVGRSMNHGNFLTAGFEIPPLLAKAHVNFTPNYIGLLTGGSPVGVNYGFTSATAGSAAANRDRANLLAVTTTTSNVANGFYINAQAAAVWHAIVPTANVAVAGSGGALGAISNAMVVAAPYAAGVALAAVVAVHLMAQAEAAKIAKRVNRARLRQINSNADHEFVNLTYRQSCAPYVDALDALARVLDELNGPNRLKLISDARTAHAAIDDWHQASVEEDSRQCRRELVAFHSAHGCVRLLPNQSVDAHQPVANRPETFCMVDAAGQQILPVSQSCAIPADEFVRKRESAVDEAAHAAHESKYPVTRVLDLISAQLTLAFGDTDALRHRLWSQNLDRIDMLQRRVQLGLERYLILLQQAQAALRGVKPLHLARARRKEVEALVDEMIDESTQVIDVLFGHRDREGAIKRLTTLRSRYVALTARTPAHDELSDLGRAIESVLEIVKEL